MNLVNPTLLDTRRMQGAAYLLVIAAWLLTGVLNGIPLFSGGHDLLDKLFGLAFDLATSAAVYVLVLAAGAKRPWISSALLLVFTAIGFAAIPSYFMLEGHSPDGNTIARVVFIIYLVAQLLAAALFFLSSRKPIISQDAPGSAIGTGS